MRFDSKHLLMAIIITAGYYVIGGLLTYVDTYSIGGFLLVMLKYGLVMGGLTYAFRDVKKIGEAFLDGLLYVFVFFIGAIVVNFVGWGASILTPISAIGMNLGLQGGTWNQLLAWPVIWGEFFGILLFTVILGVVNSTRK